MKLLIVTFLLCFCVHTTHTQSTRGMTPTTTNNSDKRLALVIGNSAYKGKPLPNAHNDALDMATQLRTLDFEVILKENLNKEEMENVIADFTRKLKNYGVALFYFAGHGFMSTQKENYLMSVEMRENLTEAFAKEKSISMETLMASMDEAKSLTKLLFLDACSNNPFRSWGRSDQKGLGSISPPEGMIAFFAASPGQEASENPGKRNGLFTQELLQQLRKPNLELTELIRNTRNQVKLVATAQSPYRVGDLSDVFYFQKTEVAENKPTTPIIEVVKNKPTTKKYMDLPFADIAFIKGGTFMMGDIRNEEGYSSVPAHRVTVSDFAIGKYEVTVSQFRTFIDATGYQTDAEKKDGSYFNNGSGWKNKTGINWRHDTKGKIRTQGENDHPVIHVSWNDAVAFCEWLSKRDNKNYRLPTEAEWEYAAGGGVENRTRFGNGQDILRISEANFNSSIIEYKDHSEVSKSSRGKTTSVGSFLPNRFDLYDMSGNIWEWCSDRYGNYSANDQLNPTGDATRGYRVVRGGSWSTIPGFSRVSKRSHEDPNFRSFDYGFRVVLSQ